MTKPAIEETQKSLKAGTLYKSLTDNQKSFDNLSASELQETFDERCDNALLIALVYDGQPIVVIRNE